MSLTIHINISICRCFTNTKMRTTLLNTEISVIYIAHIQIFILFISVSVYTATKHQILSTLIAITVPHSHICHQHQHSVAGYLRSKQLNLITTKLSSAYSPIKLLLSVPTLLRSNHTRLSPEETLQNNIVATILFFIRLTTWCIFGYTNIVLTLRKYFW